MNRLLSAPRLTVSTQGATLRGDAADEILRLAGASGEFHEN